jgi:dihydrofolate reductase
MLFDWYLDGTTPSTRFPGFRMSEPSAQVFDHLADRVGAVVMGRNTYDDSEGFGGGGPHPNAHTFVLSHRPIPQLGERQTLVTTGIADAVTAALAAADGKDVGLMGGGVVSAALEKGLVNEIVLHQVPVLLGAGRPFFQSLPAPIALRIVDVIPAPGVTHLRYEVLATKES